MSQDYKLREHPATTIQRLKALGVWRDADRLLRRVKQQFRRRFAKAGGEATAEQQLEMHKAAWDAMHDRWPPPAGTQPLESLAAYLRTTRGPADRSERTLPPLSDEAEQRFDAIGETGQLDADIVWVYHHLGDANVDPLNAPSRGAWTLLNHARRDPRQFYARLYLPVAKQQARRKGPAYIESGTYGVTEDENRAIEDMRRELKLAVEASQRMEV